MAALVLSSAHFALAADGDLDPTFGNGGVVATDLGGFSEGPAEVAVQPDGKIVAVARVLDASGERDFGLSRYLVDGTLDPSFGVGGIVLTDVGGTDGGPNAVALQPDGKVVVVGSAYNGVDEDVAIARYEPDGMLDATFASGGVAITGVGGGYDQGRSVTLQPDGKIVVVGRSEMLDGNMDFLILRYQSDGSLDPTFGFGGAVTTSILGEEHANAVEIQTDGKIVVAGRSQGPSDVSKIALARYLSDGGLDPTFGSAGLVTSAGADDEWAGADGMALQADGKIVTVGDRYFIGGAPRTSVLARFDTDGTPDFETFGPCGSCWAFGVTIQPDGKIVAAGWTLSGGQRDSSVWRYLSDGSPDPTFGSGGWSSIDTGTAFEHAGDVAIQPNGKILTGGWSRNSPSQGGLDIVLTRWEANALCGNGVVDQGEHCDDAGESASCDADCTLIGCDGSFNATAGEICDGDPCCSASCDYELPGTSCGLSDACGGDVCDGAGSCDFQPEPAGTVCPSDGDVCNGAEVCDGAGTCEAPAPAIPGTACDDDDGNICNGAEDVCDGGGACVASAPASVGTSCGASDACGGDICDGDGSCTFEPEPAGTPCDDGAFCTEAETCDGTGTCTLGTPVPDCGELCFNAGTSPISAFGTLLETGPTFADIDGDGDLDAFLGFVDYWTEGGGSSSPKTPAPRPCLRLLPIRTTRSAWPTEEWAPPNCPTSTATATSTCSLDTWMVRSALPKTSEPAWLQRSPATKRTPLG